MRHAARNMRLGGKSHINGIDNKMAYITKHKHKNISDKISENLDIILSALSSDKDEHIGR